MWGGDPLKIHMSPMAFNISLEDYVPWDSRVFGYFIYLKFFIVIRAILFFSLIHSVGKEKRQKWPSGQNAGITESKADHMFQQRQKKTS